MDEMGGGTEYFRVSDKCKCCKCSHTHKTAVCKFTGIVNMAFTPHIHKETESKQKPNLILPRLFFIVNKLQKFSLHKLRKTNSTAL